MGEYTKKLMDVKELIGFLQKETPKQIKGFQTFMSSVEEKDVLDKKQKELINVALAVAAQCEWCIALHVKSALDTGATREEIVDASMQAVLMHGGPALMYMTPVKKALEEFDDGKNKS